MKSKSQKRLYIKDWLRLKPYNKPTVTDNYYLKLSNKIYQLLISNNDYYEYLSKLLDTQSIKLLPCFIASYFEDVISETNIWNSFIQLHQELYNKTLPFYDTEEYYQEEINEQDVRFLLWYFLNTIQKRSFIYPENFRLYKMASDIMGILEEEYEYAPENNQLKKYYEISPNETNYYVVRNLIDTILFQSYLFYTDTFLDMHKKALDLMEDENDLIKNDIKTHLFANRDTELHIRHTRLLSLKGKEWAANIIGKTHPLSADILNMSKRITGYFFYKGQDEEYLFFEHIASGKKFNLIKKSFDYYDSFQTIDTIVFISFVQWKNEWWFSGVFFTLDYNQKFILEERSSIESRMAVNFLDLQNKNISETIKQQFEAFKKFNNGLPIAFMPANKINQFIKNYIDYFHTQYLNLSEEEIKAVEKRLENKEEEPDTNDIESGLVFFNPIAGIEVAFDVNSAFPAPENKYFNEEKSQEHTIRLLFGEDFSPELTMYCINNYKDKLSFFQGKEEQYLLKDIDFLLRFFKKDNYHTEPNMTFMESEELKKEI